MSLSRRSLFSGSIAAVAVLATGCSFDRGDAGGSGGAGSGGGAATPGGSGSAATTAGGGAGTGAGAGGATEVKIAGWGGTTWTRNFNLFSPTATAVTPGTNFFYEPLIVLDRTKAGTALPFLAESWKFDETGKVLTFTLRKGVTWNDGKPFTAKDVAFTWQLVLDKKTRDSYPFTKVEAVDDNTVKVTYDKPAYADLLSFSRRRILPEHIWKSEDPAAFTNPSPVGTGPFILEAFTPQQLTLKMRDGYWGGQSKGVQTVKVMAMSTDAAKDALKKGTIDYGTMGWENADKEFVALDPEHNKYTFYPVGTCDGIVFNTQKAPYNDPAVRRALRAACDLKGAATAVKVGYDVPTKAGLDASVYGDMLAADQEQKQDLELAKKELADAGWTIADGKLVKGGQSYALRYDVYQPYTEWVLTGQILADQWKKGLGLQVGINQLADQPFSQLVESGDYGMMSSSPTGGSQILDIVRAFDSKKVGTPGKKNEGNEMFFKNARLDEIATALAAIAPGEKQDEVKKLAIEAQDILTKECPFIATATAGWKAVHNTKRWTNWPEKGKTPYVANNTLPGDAVLTLLNVTPA